MELEEYMDLGDYDKSLEEERQTKLRQECFRRAQKLRTEIKIFDENPFQISLIAILRVLGVEVTREKVNWISDASWKEVLEATEFTWEKMLEVIILLETERDRIHSFRGSHKNRRQSGKRRI